MAVIAEGFALDSRGAGTLVGTNQRVVATSFPTSFRSTLALSVTDETDEAGIFTPSANSEVSVRVIDSRGLVNFAVTSQIPGEEKRFFDLPLQTNLQTDLEIESDHPGVFTVDIEVRSEGEVVDRLRRYIYLVDRQGVREPDARLALA